MLADRYGVTVEFIAAGRPEVAGVEEGDAAAPLPCIGHQLLAGRVRWPAAGGFIAGEVVDYCEMRDVYSVRLAGGRFVEASLSALREHWDSRPRAGPFADGRVCAALQESVLEVKDYRERRVWRRVPVLWSRPHQPVEWWEVRKEYHCVMDCGISQEMTELIRGRKKPNPGELARLLLGGGKPVWVPQSFWPSDVVERGGWWLRFTRVIGSRLEYQILDRHEHHVEGDMAIWEGGSGGRGGREGGASSLVRWHHERSRANILLWLEAQDLGQDPNPVVELMPLLKDFWRRRQGSLRKDHCPLPGGPPTGEPGLPYFAKRSTWGDVPGPRIVGMEFDWSFTSIQRERTEVGMVVTKGARAWLFKSGNETHSRRRAGNKVKSSQPRRWKQEGHLIEAARLAILDKGSGWAERWVASWRSQRKWEAEGHRTVAWEISSQILQLGINTLVSHHILTADPAFESVVPFNAAPATEGLVALYELGGADEVEGWRCLQTMSRWAICLREDQLTPARRAWLREKGRPWLHITKHDRAVYRSGWWTTGDRNLARARHKLWFWLSGNLGSPEPNLAAEWPLTDVVGEMTRRLATYLAGHPSYSHRGAGEDLFATDGSLRKVGDVWAMGAAAVSAVTKRGVGVRVGGGPVSSTRSELAGVFMALQRGKAMRILIDSEVAMRRLRSLTRVDGRPREHELKDLDILRAIASECAHQGTQVTLVKVDGHSGDPLHSLADRLAVEAAGDEETDAIFENEVRAELSVVFEGNSGKVLVPWPSSVTRRWHMAAADRAGSLSTRGTITGAFLSAPGLGRSFLGKALRSTIDWAVRDWMRMVSPYGLPTRQTLFARQAADSPVCSLPGCGAGQQTLAHLLLRCGNPGVHGACTQAHDRIVSILKRGLSGVNSSLRWRWEAKVGDVWPDASGLEEFALLTPDGIGVDDDKRRIHVVEVARTMDHEGDLLSRRGAEKLWKYNSLCQALKRAFPDYSVVVRDFVVGVRGSVPEDRWALHLTALGVGRGEQRRILTLAAQGSVEGSWQVLKAWRAESASTAGTRPETGRGRLRVAGRRPGC